MTFAPRVRPGAHMLPGKVGKTGLLGQTHRWDPHFPKAVGHFCFYRADLPGKITGGFRLSLGVMSSAEVDEFLAGVPEPQRRTLQTVRERLLMQLPDAQEVISYGIPTVQVDEVSVAGFSGAKNHCSYFPMSGTVLTAVADRLEGYSWSKGTLRFPSDEPLSEELIAVLVQVRQQQ